MSTLQKRTAFQPNSSVPSSKLRKSQPVDVPPISPNRSNGHQALSKTQASDVNPELSFYRIPTLRSVELSGRMDSEEQKEMEKINLQDMEMGQERSFEQYAYFYMPKISMIPAYFNGC